VKKDSLIFNKKLRDWIDSQIGETGTITQIQKLKGSTSSSLYKLNLVSGKSMILRIYDQLDWVEREPDLARHEAESLIHTQKLLYKSPELIAYDEKGLVIGMPLLLMSYLEGVVELQSKSMKAYLNNLAKALVSIHRLEIDSFNHIYEPYVKNIEKPKWIKDNSLWEKLISLLSQKEPKEKLTFIHRDFHPTNVLWEENEVSGIVDWVNACLGPAGIDIGHCRLNLALLYGVEEANYFLRSYQNYEKNRTRNQTYWDLRAIIDFNLAELSVYPGWSDFGVKGITEEIVRERMLIYIESLLGIKHC